MKSHQTNITVQNIMYLDKLRNGREMRRKEGTHPWRRDSSIAEPRRRTENRCSPLLLGRRRDRLYQPPRADKQPSPYSTRAEPGGAATTHY